MRRTQRWPAWIAATLALLGTAGPTTSLAQDEEIGLDLDTARELLEGESVDEVRMGLEALVLVPGSDAVAVLDDRIRRGLPAELLDQAIDTLALMGRREAGPILFMLARHRRSAVRRHAIEAIVACAPRGGGDAIVFALGDADPAVRAAAATALGDLGHHDGVDALFHAFERGVLEAAPALGKLIRGPEIDRFLGYLGQRPLPQMLDAFSQLVDRDDLTESVKVEAIAQLGELATSEVRIFLEELAAALPPGDLRTTARTISERIAQ